MHGRNASDVMQVYEFSEKIVSVEAIKDRSPSVIVHGDQGDAVLTVNTFVFRSEFEADAVARELSAHPVMMTDPSDPASLLDNAPTHFSQGKRI